MSGVREGLLLLRPARVGMMFAAMTRFPLRAATSTTSAAAKTASRSSAPTPPRRRRRRVLLLLPVLAALGTLGWFDFERRPDALCRQWEREARSADGERLTEIIARLDAYGRYGLPSVVRLLDADREATCEAAGEVLAARLRLVGRNGGGDDRAAAALIADELNRLVAGRSQSVSPAAVDVALELLEAVGRLSMADAVNDDVRGRMLAACDEVLRLDPSHRESPLKTLVRLEHGHPAASPLFPLAGSDEGESKGEAERQQAAEAASSPTVQASPQPAVAEPTEPATIAANTAARINPIRDGALDHEVRPATATVALPSPAARADPTRGDAWSLFAALGADDPQVAEQELRRRGFTPQEIELGRRLCSSDLDERRYYASQLPTLGGIDVRPWLLHLSRDDDDDIRLTVAAIMATSGDPELQARVRAMSIDDHDERVRATAARAVDTRTLRR